MNKSAILFTLIVLFAISIIVGFNVCWYHYITVTLKSYGVAGIDVIKRLDTFYFVLGLEVFFATMGSIIALTIVSDGLSGPTSSAWPF